MINSIAQNISNTSVRARVALCLGITESILDEVKGDRDGYTLTQKALHTAWGWVEGNPVKANEFNALLMDENEDGLLIYEQNAVDKNEALVYAWITITSCISYVAWQVYKQENTCPPGGISEVDEDVVEQLLTYATKLHSCNTDMIQSISDYLVTHYATDNPEFLGDPIKRNNLLRNQTATTVCAE